MEAKYSAYNHEESIKRIDQTLNNSDANYEDRKSIPPRNTLTFSNGFYVDCAAIFVDMRDSKSLSEKHKRPTLAKIYKTYTSKVIAYGACTTLLTSKILTIYSH